MAAGGIRQRGLCQRRLRTDPGTPCFVENLSCAGTAPIVINLGKPPRITE